MLEIIVIGLASLWLLGFVSSYTLGGFIHLFLAIAVIIIMMRMVRRQDL